MIFFASPDLLCPDHLTPSSPLSFDDRPPWSDHLLPVPATSLLLPLFTPPRSSTGPPCQLRQTTNDKRHHLKPSPTSSPQPPRRASLPPPPLATTTSISRSTCPVPPPLVSGAVLPLDCGASSLPAFRSNRSAPLLGSSVVPPQVRCHSLPESSIPDLSIRALADV